MSRHQNLIQHIKSNDKNVYIHVPIKEHLYQWIDHLIQTLFPIHLVSDKKIEEAICLNQDIFKSILLNTKRTKIEVEDLSNTFYEQLDMIYLQLQQDAEEVLNVDPAAKCKEEVLQTYPGFYAICIYRIANTIHTLLNIEYIPRMLTEYAHGKTGIDIHPGAKIDVPFLIDHGTGVVIGETCIIGKHVHLYQGVTLGALQVDKDMQDKKRHPTIEDHVVIYANATILGGNTIVGNHSVIGGNVFLTKSINPYSLVFSKFDMVIKEIKTKKEAINFVI